MKAIVLSRKHRSEITISLVTGVRTKTTPVLRTRSGGSPMAAKRSTHLTYSDRTKRS